MDLSKKDLPSAINVNGKSYFIHTEHYFIFSLIKVLRKAELKPTDIDFIFIDKIPTDKNTALKELITFIYPQRELPRNIGDNENEILLDYELDSELIYSAFMQQYKIDLFEKPLHWHKFCALLSGLLETKLNKVMEFRSYKPTKYESSEYKQSMNKLKRMWQIEKKLSDEEQKIIDSFDKMIEKQKN